MTALVRQPPRLAPLAVGAGVVAVGAAGAAVVRPELVLAGVFAVLVVGAMVLRIEWAALVYVAVEPFGDLANGVVPGAVKLVGLLLFAAWLLRLAVDERPIARHPALWAIGALLIVVIASTVASGGNGSAGIQVALRYFSYLAVLTVLIDTVRGDPHDEQSQRLRRARRLVVVFVLSCAAAGVVGLIGFLRHGGRAGGPLEDPNDFAFFLICAVPFAIYAARGSARSAILFGSTAVLLVLATLATFSRGAILGLVAMLLVAVVLRLIPLRAVLVGSVVAALAAAVIGVLAHDVITRSLAEKEHVASANVESRFASWTVAVEMTGDRPLLGHGPAGYGQGSRHYVAASVADTRHLDVAHQMYLDVSSELGLLGLAAFLALIWFAGTGALRQCRFASEDPLGGATLSSLAGLLVAASFLSEQYYLPLWLVLALGISLDPQRPTRRSLSCARCN